MFSLYREIKSFLGLINSLEKHGNEIFLVY
jgi:hypothetical protein